MANKTGMKFDTSKIERFFVRLPEELGRKEGPAYVKRVIFEAFNRIVKRTPVDTGRARAGWQIDQSKIKSQMMAEIINNVPYIVFLEFGRSGQAPQGMVRITLNELVSTGLVSSEGATALFNAARTAGAV